jgi:hypothetical protein
MDCQLHYDEATCQVVERDAYTICDQWIEATHDEDDEDLEPIAVEGDREVDIASVPVDQYIVDEKATEKVQPPWTNGPAENKDLVCGDFEQFVMAVIANKPPQADELDSYEARLGAVELVNGLGWGANVMTNVRAAIGLMRDARKDYAKSDKAVRVGLAMLEAGRAELERRSDLEEAMARR